MARFTSEYLELGLPILSPNKKAPWIIRQRLVYETDVEGGPSTIVVPEDFNSDLGTIPRWLLTLFPNDYRIAAACVVHDYTIKARIEDEPWRDKVFKEALKATGSGRIKRTFMYMGVRVNDFF